MYYSFLLLGCTPFGYSSEDSRLTKSFFFLLFSLSLFFSPQLFTASSLPLIHFANTCQISLQLSEEDKSWLCFLIHASCSLLQSRETHIFIPLGESLQHTQNRNLNFWFVVGWLIHTCSSKSATVCTPLHPCLLEEKRNSRTSAWEKS